MSGCKYALLPRKHLMPEERWLLFYENFDETIELFDERKNMYSLSSTVETILDFSVSCAFAWSRQHRHSEGRCACVVLCTVTLCQPVPFCYLDPFLCMYLVPIVIMDLYRINISCSDRSQASRNDFLSILSIFFQNRVTRIVQKTGHYYVHLFSANDTESVFDDDISAALRRRHSRQRSRGS